MRQFREIEGHRYLETEIGPEEEGLTIHWVLRSGLHLSERIIRRIKRRAMGVLLDGRFAFVTERVRAGNVLAVRLTDPGDYDRTGESVWMRPPEGMPPLDILYEDDDLIFLNKKDHVVCHPSPGHYADTLANQVAEHLGLVRGRIYPVGRLDRDTSGIVLFAKNSDAAGIMTWERASGNYKKTYRAWADGLIEEDAFTIDKALRRKEGSLMLREVGEDGQEAVTHCKVLERDREKNRTLLSIQIDQGRTHQIRVHLASIGHPILGDPLYHPGYMEDDRTREPENSQELEQPDSEKKEKMENLGNKVKEFMPLQLQAFRVDWLSPYLLEPMTLTVPGGLE
ncbi:MAG: RluA family pseudouridine synthase [Lachnospiraceae bacterium]|nr:RluA family pseudouridine synthase [Lachnospiraceae bacterium]